jgi:hypothetical protein
LALSLWLVLAAIAALALWHLRRDTLKSQTRELGLLSLALTDEIDRGLRGTQEGLQALRTELREGRLPLAGSAASQALQARANLMPLVQMLWLVDPEGRLIAASGATPAPTLASFDPGLAALPAEAMSLSRPFVDAAGKGTWVTPSSCSAWPTATAWPCAGSRMAASTWWACTACRATASRWWCHATWRACSPRGAARPS